MFQENDSVQEIFGSSHPGLQVAPLSQHIPSEILDPLLSGKKREIARSINTPEMRSDASMRASRPPNYTNHSDLFVRIHVHSTCANSSGGNQTTITPICFNKSSPTSATSENTGLKKSIDHMEEILSSNSHPQRSPHVLDVEPKTDEADFDDIGSDTESTYITMDSLGVVINDSVHRVIQLPKVCLDVIDTEEFQRLRALKQCGICNLVYPSATHSRFEHSLGVCHWARKFLRYCGSSVSNEKQLCVLLAGLCHDLGHGPFSHLWERFLKECGIIWKHEANSAIMFRSLVVENNLEPVFRKYGLESEHLDFICRLIDSNVPKDEKNFFLYEIISNKENGLDVDKFEYIMRDTKQFGMHFDLDIHRILNYVGIVEQNGVKYIGFRDKISDSLMDVFVYRAKLHRICYQHHTCKAVEAMLVDALLAADEHFRITWEENDGDGAHTKECKLSECHKYPKAFLKVTDCLFYELLNSSLPELNQSRMILKAMLKRDLYPVVFRKALDLDQKQMEILGSDMVTRLSNLFRSRYNCEFRSSFITFSIGQDRSGGDPLSKVKFFTKDRPNVPCNMSSNDKKSSSFIKENYHFSELLIFCTKGKKSILPEELDALKTQAQSIFEEICDKVTASNPIAN